MNRVFLKSLVVLTSLLETSLAFGGNVELDQPLARSSVAARKASPPADCPLSLADWEAWRDRAVHDLLRTRLNGNGEQFVDTNQVLAQSTVIANFIDDCSPYYTGGSNLNVSIGNLSDFVGVFRNNLSVPTYDHQFGYTIDDFQYLDRVRENVDLPPLLKSADFLKKVSNRETYKDAYDLIVQQNAGLPADKQWWVLLYKSRFLTTPDEANTFGRFFVYVPGDSYDKWIQFGIKIPDDSSTTPINNLSIVSIAKPDAQGRRFNSIIDWWRTYDSGWSVKLATRRESQGITENCVMCHKTSPLGIHPAEEYTFDSKGKLVVNTSTAGQIPAQLNKLIPTYGAPYFNDWADTSKYGPELGPDIQRTDQFMANCTSGLNLNPASVAKVKANMTCSNCHSNTGVGILNFPAATRHIKSAGNQVYQYISEGWMPPNKNLSSDEREGLYQCLVKEYYDFTSKTGLLIDWLKNKPGASIQMLAAVRTTSGSGESDFDDNCGGCHPKTAGVNDYGPTLFGVYNRVAGRVSGYRYSPSYVEAGDKGTIWDDNNQFTFLADPVAFLTQKNGHPSTSRMTQKFPDAALRRSIIDYLKTLK